MEAGSNPPAASMEDVFKNERRERLVGVGVGVGCMESKGRGYENCVQVTASISQSLQRFTGFISNLDDCRNHLPCSHLLFSLLIKARKPCAGV
jgi:hypothetical protein